MIVKNEEKNITRCIQSYKAIVDEVIVVDTGSVDKTVEIAQLLGAKIYYFEWKNDFSAAKNFALDKAKGDWIIFLDADEYFDQSKVKNLPNLIRIYEKKGMEIIACKMFNIDEATGEHLADFVQTRVFKNDKKIRYVNAIHERLNCEERSIRAIYIEENELAIYHTGYSNDRIIDKAERNLVLLLAELNKPVVDPTMYHFLSDAYLTLKDYEKAIEFGKQFLESGIDIEGMNSKVYQNLITAMVESQYAWGEVRTVIDKAIERFPNHPMFRLYLARLYHFTKQYENALVNYQKTIELQDAYNGIEINFITGKVQEIEFFIGNIFEVKNEPENALTYYMSALKRKKDYQPALDKMLKIIKDLDPVEIVELLNSLYDKKEFSDMEFLVEELTKQRYGKVLAYYVKHMSKVFNHQDFSLVVMFFSNQKYDQAYIHFKEAYLSNFDNSYAKLSILSAFLCKDRGALLELKEMVKPSYKRILEAITVSKTDVRLYKEDLKDYLDVLDELLTLGEFDFMEKFIGLSQYFDGLEIELHISIGNLFRNQRLYQNAILEYQKACESNRISRDDLKVLYFGIGESFYQMNKWTEALIYFEKAINAGYADRDIYEFLKWISFRLNVSAHEDIVLCQKLLEHASISE